MTDKELNEMKNLCCEMMVDAGLDHPAYPIIVEKVAESFGIELEDVQKISSVINEYENDDDKVNLLRLIIMNTLGLVDCVNLPQLIQHDITGRMNCEEAAREYMKLHEAEDEAPEQEESEADTAPKDDVDPESDAVAKKLQTIHECISDLKKLGVIA